MGEFLMGPGYAYPRDRDMHILSVASLLVFDWCDDGKTLRRSRLRENGESAAAVDSIRSNKSKQYERKGSNVDS